MYVYATGPIDFWQGWQKPADLFEIQPLPDLESNKFPVEKWCQLWVEAQKLATVIGWEGDIRGNNIFVTVIPDTECGTDRPFIIIAWKQDNNGETFVASEVALPWAEKSTSTWEKINSQDYPLRALRHLAETMK